MSVKMSPELRKLLDTIDLDANNKAEYLRKAVAEGVSLDTAYIALTLNIAEGNEKLADFHFAEMKALVEEYEKMKEENAE